MVIKQVTGKALGRHMSNYEAGFILGLRPQIRTIPFFVR